MIAIQISYFMSLWNKVLKLEKEINSSSVIMSILVQGVLGECEICGASELILDSRTWNIPVGLLLSFSLALSLSSAQKEREQNQLSTAHAHA